MALTHSALDPAKKRSKKPMIDDRSKPVRKKETNTGGKSENPHHNRQRGKVNGIDAK